MSNSALSTESNIRRADPSTIHNKFLVGYQGWFTCHGDGEPIGEGHHGWLHWFGHPVPEGGNPNFDPWPDTSAYSRDELYPAPGFKHENGEQAYLFSSRHPKTVQRHFHWMAENGVDGAFLQRFLGQTDLEQGNHGIRRLRDEVGDRVREAAEKEGRTFAIMYDIVGVQPERVLQVMQEDWKHLMYEKKVLESPNYLREKGKPVIAIWGFGFSDANHTPDQIRAVTQFLRNATPGGVYLMAGTPTHWCRSREDANPDPGFPAAFIESFDAISPWTVGRYSENNAIDWFAEHCIKADMLFLQNWEREKGKHVDYIPVVHPGGSGNNISQKKWPINAAARQGGRFLWRQLFNVKRLGATTIYGAMWDEYDEGTNFLPITQKTSQLPHDDEHKFQFFANDADGYDLPTDWYMRVAGYAAEALKGERKIGEQFPEQEIRDWFNTRPVRESSRAYGAGPSTSGAAALPDDAPPPYSAQPGYGTQPLQTAKPALPLSTRPGVAPVHGDPAVSALADNLQRQSFAPPPGPPPMHPSSHPPPSPHSVRPPQAHQGFGIPVPEVPPQGSWGQPAPGPAWPPAQWGVGAPQPQPHYPPQHPPQAQPGLFAYPGAYARAPSPGGFGVAFPEAQVSPTEPGFGYPAPGGYSPSYGGPQQYAPPPVPPRPTSVGSAPPPPPPPRRNDYPPPSTPPSGSQSQGQWGGIVTDDRRRQIQRGAGSLAERGSKLWNKFAK